MNKTDSLLIERVKLKNEMKHAIIVEDMNEKIEK
jgi:hypothetical protein